MTTLRTAAQQALEYMKSVGKMDMHPEEWAIVGRLEAALAEPQPSTLHGWVFKRNADGSIGIFAPPPKPGESQRTSDCVGTNQRDLNELLGKLADHMAALAGPVQEPDDPARRCGGPGCDMTCCQPVQEPVQEPLYAAQSSDFERGYRRGWRHATLAAPPQRKPLTDEEIEAIWKAHVLPGFGDRQKFYSPIIYARAVERAHGIGGKE